MDQQSRFVARWARRLQSEIVLPTARTIYLGIACISLAAAICGLLAALVFQMESWGSAGQEPVPDAAAGAQPSIDLATVNAHLAPPRNVRFVSTRGVLSEPLGGQETLGYFDADTSNGLPRYPDDFSIVGGRDSALFERTSYSFPGGLRTGLAPSNDLVQRINADPANFRTQHAHRFQIRVLARDAYGNAAPADVTISFVTGPAEVQLPVAAPSPPVEEVTDLQRLAGQIAGQIDPAHGEAFFDTYKRAQSVPGVCGAGTNDPMFIGEYRRAFEAARRQLTAANTEAFFVGICEAWRQATAQQAAELAQSEAARNAAIIRNQEALLRNEVAKAEAKIFRNAAISFAVAAIGAFITICLFLAFLAMENHTKAMREAIEYLARAQRPGGSA